MKRIITIQHPQSEQHVNRMIGSWGNWDLTENGVAQAHNIGKRLFTEIGADKYSIYSSDLLRAKHTAEIISGYLNTEPIYDNRLREFDLGNAVGHSKEWAKRIYVAPCGQIRLIGRILRTVEYFAVRNQDKKFGAEFLVLSIQ